ncbi:MAG: PspC domain-containing protein [Nanoarchaeota archaeon]|nr:PspC domain-containing protein [Nanoarchaeota archaeon]
MEKRLYRSSSNKIIAGVCGGLGEYLDIDPTIVRLIWAVFVLLWGFGLLLYLIAWLIVPLKHNSSVITSIPRPSKVRRKKSRKKR